MNIIDVTTEKAERVALRFQDETGSVLRLVPRERDYALYEIENLLAIFLYRKGTANIARLLVKAWPSRYGSARAEAWNGISEPQGNMKTKRIIMATGSRQNRF
jgi:hypothetical protein